MAAGGRSSGSRAPAAADLTKCIQDLVDTGSLVRVNFSSSTPTCYNSDYRGAWARLFTRQTIEDLWLEYRDEFSARAAAQVGSIIIVGGNIEGFTRTMTRAVALDGAGLCAWP
jgi:hypothetical protein